MMFAITCYFTPCQVGFIIKTCCCAHMILTSRHMHTPERDAAQPVLHRALIRQFDVTQTIALQT